MPPTTTIVSIQLDYTKPENDPVGSVSIFKRHWPSQTYQESCEVGFDQFDTSYETKELIKSGLRVSGVNFTTFSMVRMLY